jgi:signal transduction histidine kinase
VSVAGVDETRATDGRLRILVVEDEEPDRVAVRRCLLQAGLPARVDEVGSAHEALERIGTAVPDCVLLDYYLPGVDGLALLRDIRSLAVDLPVVILTGRGGEETAVELMKAGAADYVPKAVLTPERLASTVRHAMDLARASAARRRAEAEREQSLILEREARTRAERAIRMRDDVLGIVAHDLRNPVNVIAVSAATMLELPLPEDQRVRQLEIIRRSARELDRLISDLLDVTRIESGNFAIELTRVHVRALLDETLQQFEAQARGRHVALGLEAAADLPPVAADRDRLVQVVSNLLDNALKFTPAHGRVVVRARRLDKAVEIAVEDSGPGISAEHLPRVFDRFWQADRTSRSGAGLGLAICKGLIEAHGGRIQVDSALGRGTVFRFAVPCADV